MVKPTFPARGQKGPNFWDDDLQAYVDYGSSLEVVSGGSVDLPAYEGGTTPVVGYLVTATTNIEGRDYVPGVYIFYGDPGAYGGWRAVAVEGEQVVPSPDAVLPTAGTLASSAIITTGFTLTITGASDDVALAAAPYSFSTDNGTTWSAYQPSAVLVVTGKAASTAYQCKHRVKDAAGNVSTGSAITVNTPAPSGWSVLASDDFTAANGTKIKTRVTPVGGAVWGGDTTPEIQSNKMVWTSPTEDAGVILPLASSGATGVEIILDAVLLQQANSSQPYIEVVFPNTPTMVLQRAGGGPGTWSAKITGYNASSVNGTLVAAAAVTGTAGITFRKLGNVVSILEGSTVIATYDPAVGGYTGYVGQAIPNTVTVIGMKFQNSSIDNFVARKYV